MRIKSGIPFEGGDAFVSSLCKHMAERAGWDGSLEDGDDIILRQSPPSLISEAFVNRFKILSPRTWWGMIDLESKRGSLTSFNVSTMAQSAMGLLLPVLVLSLFRLAMLRKIHTASTKMSPRMLAAIFFSPWSLQCLYQLYYQLSMPLNYFRTMVNAPSSTLVRATDALKLRILHRRAYRTPRYDVYFPPSLESLDKALLFLPGASVAHEAYSEVAARLSDEGFVVAVMSLEPFRLASRHFGANRPSVEQIMQEVTNAIHNLAFENASDELPAKSIEWTLMGHSMGAFGAMQLFRTFLDDPWSNIQTIPKAKSTSTSNMDIKVGKKLVLWGVAAFVEAATDISDQTDVAVLILQGTNDVFVDMKRSRKGELEALFPLNNTTTEYIRGGTHEGFGSYQPIFQVPNNGKKKRSASLDQQHRQACDETVRFLRGQ